MREPSITTLPVSANVTVIRSPMLDWTWPSPQSGRSGWRTSIPGCRIAFSPANLCVMPRPFPSVCACRRTAAPAAGLRGAA